MLDAAFIREHLAEVKANCANRNVTADVDRVVTLDNERKRLAQETQQLQQRQNEVAQPLPREKDKAETRRPDRGRPNRSRNRVGDLETQLKQVEADLRAVLLTIPNMTHPDAPVGTDPADNKVIKTWGEPRKFDFPPKDHVALAESARPGRFRGRVAGRGAEVLLPQERGGAAGAGPGAVRHRHADQARLHADHHAGPGPRKCWKASASSRAGRRRRSTASRTPTCA